MNMDFIDERFWVALAFIIFIALFYKKLSNIIITSLDQRSNDIRLTLENAENLAKEAAHSLEICKNRQDKLKQEINKITQRANQSANNIAHESKERLESLLTIKEMAMNKKITQQENALKEDLLEELLDNVFAKVKIKLANNNNQDLSNNWMLLLDSKLKNFVKK